MISWRAGILREQRPLGKEKCPSRADHDELAMNVQPALEQSGRFARQLLLLPQTPPLPLPTGGGDQCGGPATDR